MIPDPLTMIIPLRMDEHGALRVSGTRVTFDSIIRYLSSEASRRKTCMQEFFPTVAAHRHLRGHCLLSGTPRGNGRLSATPPWRKPSASGRTMEARYPPKVTREELLKRLEARKHDADA